MDLYETTVIKSKCHSHNFKVVFTFNSHILNDNVDQCRIVVYNIKIGNEIFSDSTYMYSIAGEWHSFTCDSFDEAFDHIKHFIRSPLS